MNMGQHRDDEMASTLYMYVALHSGNSTSGRFTPCAQKEKKAVTANPPNLLRRDQGGPREKTKVKFGSQVGSPLQQATFFWPFFAFS